MKDRRDAILVINKLRKYYGDVKAVDGISFDVIRGEIFGFLGPNGAGKTTTLEMLEGLRKPDSGEAFLNDINIITNARDVKEIIGVQLQATTLYESLTVLEILTLFLSFYTNKGDLKSILDDAGLREKENAKIRELSGGQQHRLSVALALINDPEVIFLDEPTTGLDPQARHKMWSVVQNLKKAGKTIIITTHYMEEAEVLCDRLAIIDHGKIIELDTPENLIRKHQPDSQIEFTTTEKFDQGELRALVGVRTVSADDGHCSLVTRSPQKTISDLLRFSERVGWELKDLHIRRPTLEDVFLQLTGRSLRE